MALTPASVRRVGRPVLLRAASGVAPFLPWTWNLLTRFIIFPYIIGQTVRVGGFLRLTRLMNAAKFAAALIALFVFAHGPRVFGFSIHSDIYLLSSGNEMDVLNMEVAVFAARQEP